jgi:hypothetical protein
MCLHSIKPFRFCSLMLALALTLMPQTAWAQQGINTTGDPLPIGAGGSTYINVMPGTSSTPGVVFFGSNATSKATAQAWIDASDGTASFASIHFDPLFGFTAGGPMVLNNTLTVNNTATASSTAADLTVAHRIASGSASGGNGGLQVGNGQFFGSADATNFGMAYAGGWGLLMNDGSGNVGIGTAPTTNKLDVAGQINAVTYTAPGGTTALTGQGIDTVTNLIALPACSGTQALQKTGTNTFTCVNLVTGTSTGGAGLVQGQVKYNPVGDQFYYWDVPSQSWILIANAGGW